MAGQEQETNRIDDCERKRAVKWAEVSAVIYVILALPVLFSSLTILVELFMDSKLLVIVSGFMLFFGVVFLYLFQ